MDLRDINYIFITLKIIFRYICKFDYWLKPIKIINCFVKRLLYSKLIVIHRKFYIIMRIFL